MDRNRFRCAAVFSVSRLGVLALGSVVAVWGQSTSELLGVPYDWSHHHMVFSAPMTQAQRLQVQSDQRFWQQWAYRNLMHSQPVAATRAPSSTAASSASAFVSASAKSNKKPSEGLWEMNMGSGATVGTGNYPAKYSFSTSSANCGNSGDFTVYNTSLAGVTQTGGGAGGQASIIAFKDIYTGCPTTLTGVSVTATSGSTSLTTTTSSITSSVVGYYITDTSNAYIPSGTTVTSVTAGTSATLTSNTFTGTTVTGNFGQTITVNGVALTANTAVAEVQTFAFSGSTAPQSTSSITVGGIKYEFVTSTIGTVPASTCEIYVGGTYNRGTTVTSLTAAINYAGTGGTTTTWECASGATQPTGAGGATAAASGSPPNSSVTVTAKVVGSTGFTETVSGTTNVGITTTTSGSDAVNSGSNYFTVWSGATGLPASTLQTNIIAAINANTSTMLVTASATGSYQVKLTANSVGAAGNVSVASAFSSGASTFSWGATTLSGGTNTTIAISAGTTHAIASTDSISLSSIASVPGVYWAYNTVVNTGDVIKTSVILSGDGTQIAFINSNSSGSSLGLLRWKAGDGLPASGAANVAEGAISPTTKTTSVSTYESCTSSCLWTLALNGSPKVTLSSPYYDYNSDSLYVGDDSGKLHKFINVFGLSGAGSGNPSEVTTGGWPVTVSTSTGTVALNQGTTNNSALTPPVEDNNTHEIFVGDLSGKLYYVRDNVGTPGGSCASGTALPCLGATTVTVPPMVEGPLVNSSTAQVFAFGGTTNTSSVITYQIYQNNESLTGTTGGGTAASISLAGTGTGYISFPHLGAFDELYYNSISSGHMYFIAPSNASHSNHTSLYDISFSGTTNLMNTAVLAIDLTSGSPSAGTFDDSSPLTEFLNGSTDYLFLASSHNSCGASSTSDSCVYTFDITTGPPTVSTATLAIASVLGASGFVVDNSVSTAGDSEIYFTPLSNIACSGTAATVSLIQSGNATGGCAIQVSQSGLN